MSYALIGESVSSVAGAGLGAFTLSGTVSQPYANRFQDELSDGDIVKCVAREASDWLLFWGRWSAAGNTLERFNIIRSSVAGVRSGLNISLTASAAVDIVDNRAVRPHTLAGNYFMPDNIDRYNRGGGKAGGEYSGGVNRLVATPARFISPRYVSAVGLDITTIDPAGSIRLGLCRRNSDESLGELVYDSGDISTAVAGIVFVSLSSPVILEGDYYMLDFSDSNVAAARGVGSGDGNDWGNFYTQGLKPWFSVPYGAIPDPATLTTPNGNIKWATLGTWFRS